MLTVTTMLPTKCFLNFFILHKLACWPLHGVPIVVTAALHLFTHYGHAAVCWLVSSAVSCHKNALTFYFFDWHIGVSVPKCMLVCVWGCVNHCHNLVATEILYVSQTLRYLLNATTVYVCLYM